MTAASLDVGRAPVIIGGGLAGLMTALRLAPMPAVVLAKAPLGAKASSGWAQGGIAAAIGPDDASARPRAARVRVDCDLKAHLLGGRGRFCRVDRGDVGLRRHAQAAA
jgi:glycine/D-amino acid oxidase-like deaminating enzyme